MDFLNDSDGLTNDKNARERFLLRFYKIRIFRCIDRKGRIHSLIDRYVDQ